MGQQTIPVLKEKFADGKTPTGGDFGDVFDSYLHKGNKINPSQILGFNYPDEEDLTVLGDEIKFKNKAFNTNAFSGLGRSYIRKNIQGDKNILTQEMLNLSDTIYIIQYDYDLNSQSITIPSNVILKFDGGSMSNGSIVFNDTFIESPKKLIFNNISVSGTVKNTALSADLFYTTDVGVAVNSILSICDIAKLSRQAYSILTAITIYNNKKVLGVAPDKTVEQGGYVVHSTELQVNNPSLTAIFTGDNINAAELAGFYIYNESYNANLTAINLSNIKLSTIRNIEINNCNTAISIRGGYLDNIDNINIGNVYKGFYLSSSPQSQLNGCVLKNTYVKFSNVGYDIRYTNLLTLTNAYCEICHKDIHPTTALGVPFYLIGNNSITLISPYVEGSNSYIYMGGGADSKYGSNVIVNFFYNSHYNESYGGYFFDNGTFGNIRNCSIIGGHIMWTSYAGSGSIDSYPTGVIFANDNSFISGVTGGGISVRSNKVTVLDCDLAIERFNGVFVNNNVLANVPYSYRTATTANLPELTTSDAGCTIYDITRAKMIVWNGSAWSNMDGSVLS